MFTFMFTFTFRRHPWRGSGCMKSPRAGWGILAVTALTLVGCAPPVDSPKRSDAGADADAGADTAADGKDGGDAGAAVTYTKDVQPILMAKCSPCHTTEGLGNHNLASTYADAMKPVESVDSTGCWNDADQTMFTMPKKVGECALILIMSGRMPMGAGCGGSMPLDPSACLSADQKATIAAWVAAGLPQ
jgi:hypothetical protein